ncbi:hypothetical protein DEO72_LG7g2047 [Vigna unguiculata]|uniref:Thrombospondin-related anonymous protein n=1 Tax=Vigna unguiculata TaxID=3917 RepID=A0A4D6ML76_VIGUN|nr:hypothetical protein DEO72_LG7g2047 [Vigna unguiculata]
MPDNLNGSNDLDKPDNPDEPFQTIKPDNPDRPNDMDGPNDRDKPNDLDGSNYLDEPDDPDGPYSLDLSRSLARLGCRARSGRRTRLCRQALLDRRVSKFIMNSKHN